MATVGLGLGLFSLSMMPQATTVTPTGPQVNTGDEYPAPGTLGGPIAGLTQMQLNRWAAGREVFDRDFHEVDGLGSPSYNADSCRACHQDGAMGGGGGLVLNVSRFANDNGGVGPFTDLPGGQGLSKFMLPALNDREEYDDTTADVFEQRQTPPIFGAGRIEAIAAVTILANEDLTDANGDGIYGIGRIVMVNGAPEVGRFGWKNQVPLIIDFTRDAMNGECGITTPDNGRGFGISSDGDAIADPELSTADAGSISFFMSNLAEPPRTGSNDPEVLMGETLFTTVGCNLCHKPTLADNMGQPVRLYSNLLLHNVMPANYRGMSEPGGDVGYFGTPPLWGIRHSAPYMHDGRASDLNLAILAHEGEASGVTAAYVALDQMDKDALIAFLNDI